MNAKIGDKVKITAIDRITAMYLPNLIGTTVKIVQISELGLPMFFDDTVPPEDFLYKRTFPEHFAVNTLNGWEYEIVVSH